MSLKYVVVKDEFDREAAILLPERIKHIEAAFYFHRSGMAISAGFYYVDKKTVIPYGKSESLHLDSRPEDAELIQEVLNIKERSSAA